MAAKATEERHLHLKSSLKHLISFEFLRKMLMMLE